MDTVLRILKQAGGWHHGLYLKIEKLYLWRRDYNHQRPHSALDDRTPAEFAATCAALTAS